jgi:membrane protease YdiL (CAAX protease family)
MTRRLWLEVLGLWLVPVLAIRAAAASGVPPHWVAIVGGMALLYVPVIWLICTRRPAASIGLTWHRFPRALALAGAISATTLVPIVLAMRANEWQALPALSLVAGLVTAEVFLVALPEEVFFRGYLQSRLDEALPARARILGADMGWAVPVASLLFVASHFAVAPRAWTVAILIPSLVFGWMRARTGSLAAPILYHAACNAVVTLPLIPAP